MSSEVLSEQQIEIANIITILKETFLDSRNVSVRAFSKMSGIPRPRLLKLFSGDREPLARELSLIGNALVEVQRSVATRKASADRINEARARRAMERATRQGEQPELVGKSTAINIPKIHVDEMAYVEDSSSHK